MKEFLESYRQLLQGFVQGGLDAAAFVRCFEEQVAPGMAGLGPRARGTLSLMEEDIQKFKGTGTISAESLRDRARVNLEMTEALLNAPWGLTAKITEWLEETTVGSLDGQWAAMGNCGNGEYALPDGTMERGPCCTVVLDDETQFVVGKGSAFTWKGKTWHVTKVTLNPGGLGSVDLEATTESVRRKARQEEVDFFFLDRCDACGGRTGWHGLVEGTGDNLHIGMWCVHCPTHYRMTSGKVREAFLKDPPRFTPGRAAD